MLACIAQGAAYYYETENRTTSYEQTMIDAKAWMQANRVPTVGYQFDSWWYPQDSKRPGGPVITWEPIRGPSPDKRMNGAKVIPTPLHVLGRISPIFSPFFLVFCAFSPSRRDGSNEPHAGTQG